MFIENLSSPRTGNPVPNQFMLDTNHWRVFQSYSTVIMKVNKIDDHVEVAGDPWSYSMTTSKYVNEFLRDYTYINPDELKKAIREHKPSYNNGYRDIAIGYVDELEL